MITMKTPIRLGWCLAIAGAICGGHTMAAELKPGDTAPDFELPGSDGKTYKLSDFKGKQTVVVAWFPKAFTGG
jgi:peroxiredoxin Q/BCP